VVVVVVVEAAAWAGADGAMVCEFFIIGLSGLY